MTKYTDENVDEYLDLSLLNRIQRRRRFTNDNNGDVIEEGKQDNLSEDLMSRLEKYIGDGQARVTVSGALSSSHEYHKAEAFVSVSVSCNNDMNDVEAVHNLILRPCVQELVYQDHEEMSLLRDAILPENQRKHGDTIEDVVVPPTQDIKVAKPPRRTSKVKLGGKGKPDFRRR